MKKVISYLCLVGLCTFLFSCESESKPQEVDVIEKAIEASDNYDSYSRSYHTMINKIYEEILKTDTALSNLEESTNRLLLDKNELEKPFKLYDERNTTYYKDANELLNDFTDSLLKQKYRALIQNSQANYSNKTQELRNIINSNDLKTQKITELRAILKLTKTLPFIEKYQDKAKPDKDTLIGIDKELNNKIDEIQKFIPR
jgi:hypothetical protein